MGTKFGRKIKEKCTAGVEGHAGVSRVKQGSNYPMATKFGRKNP